jgi:hypothetical protein
MSDVQDPVWLGREAGHYLTVRDMTKGKAPPIHKKKLIRKKTKITPGDK